MIKPKTKEQKKIDRENYNKSLEKLKKPIDEFMQGLWDCEFDPNWIRMGTISDLNNARSCVRRDSNIMKETHTFTSYDDDSDNEFFRNATNLDYYKKGGK